MSEQNKTVYDKLLRVQQKLVAPKNQYNSFGKYKYRSCEDILEAVKPIAHTEGCVVVLSDDIELIGNRFYVKATASLIDTFSGQVISNTAYAREEDDKKGMDGSQITGTASSYARKYALNGLFSIDDSKDADTDEHHNQTNPAPQRQQQQAPAPQRPAANKITEAQRKKLFATATENGFTEDDIHKFIQVRFHKHSVNDLTSDEANNVIDRMNQKKEG